MALALTLTAVVLMFMPTYATAWGVQGGRMITYGPWYDFLLIAYFNVVPFTALVCGMVMAVGLSVGLVRRRAVRWIALPGMVAAVLLLLFGYDTDQAHFVTGLGEMVAPLLAVAAALVLVSQHVDSPPSPPGQTESTYTEA